MCIKRKWVAILVAICMFATMLPTVPITEYKASEKVGSELLELMNVTYDDLTSGNFVDSGETYSCIIWIEDVEIEEAVEAGIDAAEMTREDYSTWSLYDYPYTTYEADGLTYVDVTFDETESDEYVQTYIETEREAAVEMYSANNSSFVAENFMARDMSVTYISQYSPCVFADLSVTKIAELIDSSDVVSIGYVNNNAKLEMNDATSTDATISVTEIEEAMEIIAADRAIANYNVTGDGVKIGQIELACPDVSSIVVNPNGCNTMDKVEEDEVIRMVETTHPDNVYLIMSTVAPDATYYATGAYNGNTTNASYIDFYQRVEWLLSQGVNVINYSAGHFDALSEYDERSRWTDHIAYNHDVHFVMSAGNYHSKNNPQNDVYSPGMAYNIITVGATERTYPYEIEDYSSYNDSGIGRYVFRTNKPDMCAPGSFTATSGTSFSAPLVTATIALMCEYEPALKTRQHTVKAILAASVGKETQKYVSSDNDFAKYGAGIIDARAAIWVIKNDNFTYTTGAISARGETKTYEMEVTSNDTLMRVALAYANRVKFASGVEHDYENTPMEEMLIADLTLSIYAPDGELVTYEMSFGKNLLVVEFDPRLYYTSGTYIIEVKVQEEADNETTVNYGIAWR